MPGRRITSTPIKPEHDDAEAARRHLFVQQPDREQRGPGRHGEFERIVLVGINYARAHRKLVRPQGPASISRILSNPEYWKMSRMCGVTRVRRMPPPPAIRRFCVLSRTPSPALDTYSSAAQSSTTRPLALSRKACAAGAWAASRRPDKDTTPSGPASIESIRIPLAARARPSCGTGCGPFALPHRTRS